MSELQCVPPSIRPSYERKVLVIYAGGTIGMIKSSTGALVCGPGMLESTIRKIPHLHDSTYAQARFGESNPNEFLVLPEVPGEAFVVIYKIIEYEPILDSSNMTMNEWIKIAVDLKDNYGKYDGFVILHGTDTMAYTTSVLSFMIENLGKSTVLTGAQIPLYESRSQGSTLSGQFNH